jgi:pyrroline-5-carboxylate reductase
MKTPHINKQSTLTILIVLVVFALLGLGLAKYEINKRNTDAHNAAVASAHTTELATKDKQIKALTTEVSAYQSKNAGLCSYLSGLTIAKATRSLVTLPVLNCAKP